MVVRMMPFAHLACVYASGKGSYTLLALVSECLLMASTGHTGRVTQIMIRRTSVKWSIYNLYY